ncbi:MAG: hypothetical protein ABI999_13735 [Acidobacteriota bacterium]
MEYTFWGDGDFFLGYINDYSGFHSQGSSQQELIENPQDLRFDIPHVIARDI